MVQLSRLHRRRNEDGVVAILMSLMTAGVFLGLAALVVNLGMARDTKQASQIASDASALAAANSLYPTSGVCKSPVGGTPPCFTDAIASAKGYAQVNLGVAASAWNGCVPPSANPSAGYTDAAATNSCIWFDSTTKPTMARVTMPTRAVPGGFGAIYGTSQVNVSTSARAVTQNPVAGKCALCFLGGVNTGNADFSVSGGSIAVNGSINAGPNSVWSAPNGQIGVVGAVSGGQFHPAYTPTTAFTDPFATTALPSGAGLTLKTSPCSAGPGIYGDAAIPGGCNLQPGLYVIVGTWSEGNNSLLGGTGVTLYFTCGSTSAPRVCNSSDAAGTGGRLDGKNGDVSISAGAPDFAAWAIIYDRQNPNDIQLQGNGKTSITGGVYAPNTTLGFNGNSCFGFDGGPVVVQTATGNGNKGCVEILNSHDATLKSTRVIPSLDQ